MAGTAIGNLNPGNLLEVVLGLTRRVARLEAQARVQPLTMILDGVTLGSASTSYVRLAWTAFPRAGSKATISVNVTLTGAASMDLALRAAGSEIKAITVTSSGPASLGGYLPDSWDFGEHATLEVVGKLNSPTGSASGVVVVLGAVVG